MLSGLIIYAATIVLGLLFVIFVGRRVEKSKKRFVYKNEFKPTAIWCFAFLFPAFLISFLEAFYIYFNIKRPGFDADGWILGGGVLFCLLIGLSCLSWAYWRTPND